MLAACKALFSLCLPLGVWSPGGFTYYLQVGSNFPVDEYQHMVEYIGQTIHNILVAKTTHIVNWRGRRVRVEAGTKLLMSCSDKYSVEKIDGYGQAADL